MKRKFIAYLGFIIIFVSYLVPVKANHVFAADISYRYVGHDTIELKLVGYRDCNGIDLVSVPFNIITSCGSNTSVNSKQTGGLDATPVCKRHCTRCTNQSCGYAFGIQQYFQKATVALKSFNCCDFTFFWEQCCRSNSFSTIKPIASGYFGNFTVSCKLNTCISGYHSSPSFINNPLLIVCRDQCTRVSQAVSAMNGDSIFYRLSPALLDYDTPVVYYSPYSYKEPLKYYGAFGKPTWDSTKCQGFGYDSVTGMLNFKAIKEDITDFGLIAEQWHKDSTGKYKLIGTTMRSSGLAITNCSDHAPYMTDGYDGKGGHTLNVYANAGVTFNIATSDSDYNDTLALTWNKGIPNATFKVGAGLKPTGTFSWIPKGSDISTKPYIFSVTVDDNHCPLPIKKQQVFYIYVKDSFPSVKYNKIDSGCGKYSFAVLTDTSKHLIFQWFIDGKLVSGKQQFSYLFNKNGKHTVHLYAGNNTLSGKDVYDTLNITSIAEANAGPDVYLCPGDKGYLSASGGTNYKWTPSTGLSSDTISNPVATPAKSTKYIVKVTSKAGCINYDTINVNNSTLFLKVTPLNTTVCGKTGTSQDITINVQYPKNKKTFSTVRFLPGGASVVLKDTGKFTVIANKSGQISVYITDKDSGCAITNYYPVIFSSPTADAGPDKTICKGDSIQLTATGGKSYQWKAASGIKNLNTAKTYVRPLSNQRYYVTVTDTLGCQATDSVLISVVNPKTYTFFKPSQICPLDTAIFSVTGSSAYSYAWASSTTLQQYSGGTYLKAFPYTSTTYFVTITDNSNGCKTKDSVTVVVDNDCVFPGDANKDKTANYLDLLPIGVALGSTGTSRSGATTNWRGQPSTDWSKSIGKVNYKHIDCDGNGYIDYRDTLSITKNYSRSHPKKNTALNERSGNPPFYFAFDKPAYIAGDTVKAALYLGSNSRNVSVLGAGVKYAFGNNFIKPGSLKFTFSCEFICSALDVMKMYRTDNLSYAEGSLVRADHKASSGYGKIADITYLLLDSTKATYSNKGDTIRLDMMEKEVIDAQGADVTIDGQSGKAAVYRNKASVPASIELSSALSGLSIYPNPFTHEFTLSLQLQRQARVSISCYDALCREVSKLMDKDLPAANNSFNFQDREAGISQPGIYFIKVQVGDEVSIMRMVKM